MTIKHVLLLGEGNFSFSLSLSKLLEEISLTNGQIFKMYATSFDCREEVIRKYPESKSILYNLSSKGHILHNIDASQSLNFNFEPSIKFDDVIFNFPHLGLEDLHLHSQLLAHILHRYIIVSIVDVIFIYCSVREVLSSTGIFHLTLAADQAQNWKLYYSHTLLIY